MPQKYAELIERIKHHPDIKLCDEHIAERDGQDELEQGFHIYREVHIAFKDHVEYMTTELVQQLLISLTADIMPGTVYCESMGVHRMGGVAAAAFVHEAVIGTERVQRHFSVLAGGPLLCEYPQTYFTDSSTSRPIKARIVIYLFANSTQHFFTTEASRYQDYGIEGIAEQITPKPRTGSCSHKPLSAYDDEIRSRR